jgi:hypothetical protein
MIQPVSRLFILVLIALLPLRAWSVERMAVHMAANEVAAATSEAAAGMPADCPMDMTAAEDNTEPQTERGCQSCQLCMSLSPAPLPLLKAPGLRPPAKSSPLADRYASAELARLVKPPIT